jgi:hypothetical protein
MYAAVVSAMPSPAALTIAASWVCWASSRRHQCWNLVEPMR